jgi:hypothetical protein
MLLAFKGDFYARCDPPFVWYQGECHPAASPFVPPPAIYDGKYVGRKTINVAKDMKEMADFCYPADQADRVLGCAFRFVDRVTGDARDTRCYIYLAPESYIRTQYRGLATPENVLRHELAHCNGWPGDHPH